MIVDRNSYGPILVGVIEAVGCLAVARAVPLQRERQGGFKVGWAIMLLPPPQIGRLQGRCQ